MCSQPWSLHISRLVTTRIVLKQCTGAENGFGRLLGLVLFWEGVENLFKASGMMSCGLPSCSSEPEYLEALWTYVLRQKIVQVALMKFDYARCYIATSSLILVTEAPCSGILLPKTHLSNAPAIMIGDNV